MISGEYILKTIRSNKDELGKFGIHRIGLFGSYIRNEQSRDSDIDILIEFYPDQESFDNFMAICDYIENLFRNKKIEVITRNSLSSYIGPSILNEVVYA